MPRPAATVCSLTRNPRKFLGPWAIYLVHPRHQCMAGARYSWLMRLSVLDQSISVAGRSHGQSIRDTVALAKLCDRLGYARFWCSEHHNHPTIVGTAPEILLAAIATQTERIRLGSAGIMLPHYAPLKVAEQFRVLD